MLIDKATRRFLDGYFATNERKDKTKSAYLSDLAQFRVFAGIGFDVSTLSNTDIERWARELKTRGYSPASIRRKIVVLKVFCAYWVRNGLLTESPFWRVKINFGRMIQLPRTLTAQEARDLLVCARQDYRKAWAQRNRRTIDDVRKGAVSSPDYLVLRNIALLELLFATGMRVGEVSAIDVNDFLSLEARFKVKGKGGRERMAFVVDPLARKVLSKYLAIRQKIQIDCPALFLNAKGSRLSTQGIANVIKLFQENSGIERRLTPHMLRHTVATLLLRNGVDIRVVQEFLGHSSIATTQRYTHVSNEHLIGELQSRHPSLSFR